ncbi:ferrichrome transport system permease protein FhuB [Psychrobacter sp. JCM 18902]|nr:ferrichrome transport system permease protein FhuB [Psychrobacter sp. JCM 18902]
MTINTAEQTHHSHTNNTTDYVKPMTSLAASQSPTLKTPSEQHSKLMQKPPNPAPKLPRQPPSVFADTWRIWAVMIILVVLSVWSTWLLINQEWTRPISDLFIPSSQLDIISLATQLHIVATSIVALLAGGLLGVVSILLQQLVKNPLASDTTLGVGVGAQLAMLIVTLFLPSLAIYGGLYVAFVGALISMGLVFVLSAPSRFNPLILILAGLVVNILLAAVANVLVLFFAERSNGMLSWAAGFLAQNSWHTSTMLAITAVMMAVVCLPLLKPLTLMSLDDSQASAWACRLTVYVH